MTELLVFIPGKPVPQGSKRWLPNGRMDEANKDLRPWRAVVTDRVMKAMEDNGITEKMTGPILVTMTFHMKRPKDHYGTGKNEGKLKPSAPRFHAGTPDVDKLVRAINDAITDAGLWKDDSQVALLSASKHYGETQGAFVSISTVNAQ